MEMAAAEAQKRAKLRHHAQTHYAPRGVALDLQQDSRPEIVLSGPAGTGKSRACLEKIHRLACEYPRSRYLIIRKTRESLSESALFTFENYVLPADSDIASNARRNYRQVYRYPNHSEIVVGGLDKSSKIMSTEYDIIFVQEAIELVEDEWEMMTTRLRNNRLPVQQIIADTNPSYPRHWLKQRADKGQTLMLESRHEDNPVLWRDGEWTAEGKVYIARLDALTGARYWRLRRGRWVQAEGVVYEDYDPNIHLIPRFEIPANWRRFRVIAFGFVNPFTCSWLAVDPDDNLYLYREIYMTHRTVQTHAPKILELSEGETIEATVCDHDAEDRATLEENGIPTIAANKAVSVGIQKVQERLKKQENGKPRLFILRDSLVETDQALLDAKKPVCTEQEFDSYIWADKANKEEPVKENDHGVDSVRYGAMYADQPAGIMLGFV